MKQKWLLVLFLLLLSAVGITWAQSGPPPEVFVPYRQIGELRPFGVQYDQNFDRFVWVDRDGRLVLVDAATYTVQHVLYASGAFNAYRFSHDGTLLALAIDRRVELWDTASGERRAVFEPSGANLVQGRLHFTNDDSWLLLDTVVPAPPETRRSENDTSIIPWLWDVNAALERAPSRVANGEIAQPFFNFRNGLVVGANTFLIAGLPGRLQVLDGRDNDFPVTAEILSSRFERDPITVWESATDELMYVDPVLDNVLAQVNTRTGTVFNVPLGRDLSQANLADLAEFTLSDNARTLCGIGLQHETSLLRLIFGDNYGSYQGGDPLTGTLLDVLQPMTMEADRGALLVSTFNETRGRGVIELLRPVDISALALSPDRAHLLVRRASGTQPVEVYGLDSCALEQIIYPTEPDPGGGLLAYNATGNVILADFERFDAATGERLAGVPTYTTPFDYYVFSADNRSLITLRGGEWLRWDIETGRIAERKSIALHGEVLAVTPDQSRYLTRADAADGITLEIVDIRADQRRPLTIPYPIDGTIEQIIPSDDWENALVVYGLNPTSQHYPGNAIAVYNFDRGQLIYAAGDDLPQPEDRAYGWLDARTVYISSFNTEYRSQPERIHGIEYHTSGLPACLVAAFPDDWRRWQPVWENLTLTLRADSLNRLAARMCAALPAAASEVIAALTPTPRATYVSLATPAAYVIPGVPTCLTRAFPGQSVDYAALWREMTVDLTAEAIATLETMLCEGLITSLSGIEPTATVNPNMLVPPTATPVDAAPESVEGADRYRPDVIAIDILTGNRTRGDYLPPQGSSTPGLDRDLLSELWLNQFGTYLGERAVSADGNLLAVRDANGFVQIYRLTRSYNDFVADELNAIATRAAGGGPSIGLLPTATLPFDPIGEIRPTLTPTITPTPPPLPSATAVGSQVGTVEDVCPARTLSTLDALPPGFAPPGRLFTAPPPETVDAVWVLNPRTGAFHPDNTIPRCHLNGSCYLSPNGAWMVYQADGVLVAQPDGSAARTLFPLEAANYFPEAYAWAGSTLVLRRREWLPDERNPVTVLRDFDPATGLVSAPYRLDPPVEIAGLPTTELAWQPGGPLALVSTPYGIGGAKYYLYDAATGTAAYFARSDDSSLWYEWRPDGGALYYHVSGTGAQWNVYDVRTGEHAVLGEALPGGTWSPDGRYRVEATYLPTDEVRAQVAAGDLPPQFQIWDSHTGVMRRFCVPESGLSSNAPLDFTWSPDSRYVAFLAYLPPQGDAPNPTGTPDEPPPTATPIPLEQQYQFSAPRTIIVDTQTGQAVVVQTGIGDLLLWTEGGE